jgi:5-methyltetrahydropteroyltriglutamate--homocysteine methyltransferase
MFTATKDVVLPTTVTGSWPRPSWFTQAMWGRPLDTAMMDIVYREQFLDATTTVVNDQERAGLDIITNGDYFLDPDFAGRSWHHYPLQRWLGVEGDELQPKTTRSPLLSYPQGTLLQEIYTSWRWPVVTGKIEHNPRNPLEYAKIWRIAQARAHKPVKFGTVSAQVMAFFLDSHNEAVYPLSDEKKQIIWDMSTAINLELREVAASGCKVIQVEEPTIHMLASYYPELTDTIDFLVEAFNHEVSGLEGCEIWAHTCWGNPMMQRVMDKSEYANSIETYLERLDLDVWTVEMKDRNQNEIELFEPYKGRLKKKVAVGVVSHRTLQADRPEDVAEQARRALKYIDAENLVLSSDCGFGRQGASRTLAFFKATAIAQGANIVRRELGAPETYIPAADEQLAMDYIPES